MRLAGFRLFHIPTPELSPSKSREPSAPRSRIAPMTWSCQGRVALR